MPEKKTQGLYIVLDLTVGLKGRNETVNNFFYFVKNTLVGIIRKNTTEVIPQIFEIKGRSVSL